MKIESIRLLRGPNRWSDRTLLEAILVLDSPTEGEVSWQRVEAALPELAPRMTAGVACQPRSARFWAHALGRLVLELQRAAGIDVELTFSAPLDRATEARLAVEYREEASAELALKLALELIDQARAGGAVDVASRVEQLRRTNEDVRLGPSTGAIADAARARGIPVRRLTDGSLLQLGYGSQQRRVWAAETDRTSAIAEAVAQDKDLTKALLAVVGVPVPQGRPAASAEDAWAIAQEIGLPVAVKPQKGNQGKGVSVGLRTREAVQGAYEIAARRDG